MLRDRITGLRTINVYEPHRCSHQISGLAIESIDGDIAGCRSNYLVIRTMIDGAMSIFSAGVYLDKVVLGPCVARFLERVVVADSRRIETCWYFHCSCLLPASNNPHCG
jgi:anthranilate 1,2-dioxygenase small subunit